jgi:hypothetical protein
MKHVNRRWVLHEVNSPESLASMLSHKTSPPCTGFNIAGHSGYLFLSDSGRETLAPVYAVLKRHNLTCAQPMLQLMGYPAYSSNEILRQIHIILAGVYDSFAMNTPLIEGIWLDIPGTHHRCSLCR